MCLCGQDCGTLEANPTREIRHYYWDNVRHHYWRLVRPPLKYNIVILCQKIFVVVKSTGAIWVNLGWLIERLLWAESSNSILSWRGLGRWGGAQAYQQPLPEAGLSFRVGAVARCHYLVIGVAFAIFNATRSWHGLTHMGTNHYKEGEVIPFHNRDWQRSLCYLCLRNLTTITVFAIIISDLATHRRWALFTRDKL